MTEVSERDLALIEGGYFPVTPRPDLIHPTEDDSLVLTVKGIRFFQTFARRWGVTASASHLRTKGQFSTFRLDCLLAVAEAVEQETQAALLQGAIPQAEQPMVRALLYGSLSDIEQECRRFADCREAGENVIPATFRH